MLVTIALAVMNGYHISYGTGLHISELPQDLSAALIPTLKYWYAYQIIYPLVLLFVKLSFLALYRRIFGQKKSMRLAILFVGAIVVAYTVIVMFVNVWPNLEETKRFEKLTDDVRHSSAAVMCRSHGIRPFQKAASICQRRISPWRPLISQRTL